MSQPKHELKTKRATKAKDPEHIIVVTHINKGQLLIVERCHSLVNLALSCTSIHKSMRYLLASMTRTQNEKLSALCDALGTYVMQD